MITVVWVVVDYAHTIILYTLKYYQYTEILLALSLSIYYTLLVSNNLLRGSKMTKQQKEQLLDIATDLMQVALLTENEFNAKYKMTKDKAIMVAIQLIKLFIDTN